MGKASKWIRNLLLGGKRDHEKDDDKKGVSSIVEETLGSSKEIISVTKEKRRWSFRKYSTTDKITHRNASFDSISTVKLVKQVLEEHEIEQIRIKAVFVKTSNEVDLGSEGLIATTPNLQLIESQLKDDAAIKIQSVFRSYLARKALRALRALVKLQALVRGHLVRKQTTTVLRCMHALMTIQVRARYKRVQMVEAEAENSMKRTSHGESTPDNLPSKIHNSFDKTTANVHEQRRSLKSKSGPLNHPKAERMEQGLISRSHSSRVDQHDTKCWNPSTVLTEIISSQKNVQNISDNESKTKRTELLASTVPQPNDNPSYMSNTESSKAKARSQSEPKQRPKWHQKQRIRQSTSTEGANVNPEGADQHTSCHLRLNEQENQQPWFVKLYRSAKPVKDGNVDSLIITTSHSNYGKSLNPFEVCSKPLANA